MVDEAVRTESVCIRVDQGLLRDCESLITKYAAKHGTMARVTRHRLLYIAMRKGIESLKREYGLKK